MIRRLCYDGVPWMVWGGFVGDLGIAIAYQIKVPLFLHLAVSRGGGWKAGKGALPLFTIGLWIAFIWSCGLTHLAEAMETWMDLAKVVVILKLMTCAISWAATANSFRNLELFSTLWSTVCDVAQRVRLKWQTA